MGKSPNKRNNTPSQGSNKSREQTPGPNPPTPPESPERPITPMRATSTSIRSGTPHLRVDTRSTTGAHAASPSVAHQSANAAAPIITIIPTSVHGGVPNEAAPVMDNLITEYRATTQRVGELFGTVAKQMLAIATLGPAVDAQAKINALQARVNTMTKAPEGPSQKAERQVEGQVKEYIKTRLRPVVDGIVADAVKGLILERVRQELHAQVPQELKEELDNYRRRLLEVKIKLANDEARRRNQQINKDTLDEPLQPLLRPLLQPDATTDTTADGANGTAGPSEKKQKQKQHQRDTAEAAMAPADDGAGKPSNNFPKSVTEVAELEGKKVRKLLGEYGIPLGVEDGEWEKVGGEDEDDAKTVGKDKGKDKSGGGSGNKGGTAKPPGQDSKKDKVAYEKKEAEKRAQAEAEERARVAHVNRLMEFVGLVQFYIPPPRPQAASEGGQEAAAVVRSPLLARQPTSARPW